MLGCAAIAISGVLNMHCIITVYMKHLLSLQLPVCKFASSNSPASYLWRRMSLTNAKIEMTNKIKYERTKTKITDPSILDTGKKCKIK